MIDWINVAFNALWISGLAILLAAVSYHRWLTWEQDATFRELMSRRSWKLPFAGGMLLVCGGIAAGIAERGWERAIWTGLGAFYGYQLMLVLRRPDKPTRS
jgi:hypothetical protein